MDHAAPDPPRPRRRGGKRSGLRTRRIAPGLGWYVVQEVTGEPVHQLGFQSPATAKGFEEHLAGLHVDWADPALGRDPGIGARIMRWRTTWLFLCLDGPRPYHRPHGLRLVS